MKMFRSLAALVCVLSCLMAAGCSSGAPEPPAEASAPAETAVAAAAETQAPVSTTVPDDVEIATKFGTLHFPEQWSDCVAADLQEREDCVKVIFSAVIEEEAYPLFLISIGDEDGVEVGVLTAEDGSQRPVYANVFEILENEALEEGQQNRLYAMQEDLNYLIDNLK